MSVQIRQTDILTVEADAIVNPANSHLRHGGGLAAKIDSAALQWPATWPDGTAEGTTMTEAEKRAALDLWSRKVGDWKADHSGAPLVATGDCYVTSAGMLPLKGVIHAVGPVWGGGQFCEPDLLYSAHYEAFMAAAECGWTRLAVPAISCGIFGYPVAGAAAIAMEAARYFTGPLDITFCLWENEHFEAYCKAGYTAGLVTA
jgi:O-acetyl-ADP-ribose deacetylase (regulator of RNase III)